MNTLDHDSKYPTPENFLHAIHKDSNSPELNFIFSELKISRQDLDHYQLDVKGQRIWSNDILGLQLEFKDIGLLEKVPYHDIDEGPWVLTDVIFWGWQRETNTFYMGPLPYGLDFSMDRDQVRIKLSTDLGEPEIFGFSNNIDAWRLGEVEITVDYDGARGIRCISLGLPVE